MPYRKKDSPYWWVTYTDNAGRQACRTSKTTDFKEAKVVEHELALFGLGGQLIPVNNYIVTASVRSDFSLLYLLYITTMIKISIARTGSM